MKRFLFLTILIIMVYIAECQNFRYRDFRNHINLISGSENSKLYRTELYSDIDSTWANWKLRGYYFGFDPTQTPMFTNVNSVLSTPYMIQVRGNEMEKNKKRWGYHLFEGYARDDKSRITLLVNKHIEEGKPVGELYYYGTAYNHSEAAYNWIKIGSDVRKHSFLFGRDKAIFYGSLKLTNTLTLGNIDRTNINSVKPKGDDETNADEDARYVNFKELKECGNGTLFYDSENHLIVIKINGKWMKLAVEELPSNIKYEFN